MRSKITAFDEIVKSIHDGMQIMIGGFGRWHAGAAD